VQVERTRCNRNVRANVRSGLLRNRNTRNGINERKVRRWQRKERAGQGVVLKDVRPGLSFSQVLSVLLVANIVTRLFPAQTPPPRFSSTKHQVPQALAAVERRGMETLVFDRDKTAWQTCRIRVPTPPKTQVSKPSTQSSYQVRIFLPLPTSFTSRLVNTVMADLVLWLCPWPGALTDPGA
jgi:hypothetical protein